MKLSNPALQRIAHGNRLTRPLGYQGVWPMWLNLVGLIFNIVGAWLLAYDIIWGHPKKLRAKYANLRLSFSRADHQRLKNNADKLIPPYNEAEVAKIKEGIDAVWLPFIQEDEEIVKASGEAHQESATIAAIFGIILLSLGFLLQFLAVIFP